MPLAAVVAKSPEEANKTADKKNLEKKEEKKDGEKKSDKQEYVFVYNPESKKVELRQVKTGISDFENIEIKEGLKAGEKIVVGPFQAIDKKLKNGDEVQVLENKKDKK